MSDGNHIAIVGMACRLPGASTADEFWQRLLSGRDSFTDLDEAALIAAGVRADTLADPAYIRRAPLLDDIAGFDPDFFRLSIDQASLLDPQHRLFFECAVEALTAAGHDRTRGETGPVGIFAGCSISSYLLFNLLGGLNPGASPAALMAMIGNDKDYLPSRLAYLLGLSGPTVAVQTACSTSLTAVHLACQSLLSGECDVALAGGASVRVPHRVGYRYEDGSILSPSGHCRSFDAAADGTVFGSGVGVVALKRLGDALADGDLIDGVILASAINNDASRKAGFTAPGVDGQAAVVAEALALSGLSPSDIGYIEAHGTATPIGDPIELRALAQVFPLAEVGQGRIGLGSAKATVGHLEAAAGVTGLIAAVQALKFATIPPVAGFTSPNPALALESTAFSPSATARPWPQGGGQPRRAGVSSFGIGGANAHVVLQQAPDQLSPRSRPAPPVFNRQRCWIDPQPSGAPSPVASPAKGWPGSPVPTPLASRLYELALTPDSPRWLDDHRVMGHVTWPGAAYAALAADLLRAEKSVPADGQIRLGSLDILHPLTIPSSGVTLHSVVSPDGGIDFYSRDGVQGDWRQVASMAPASAVAALATPDFAKDHGQPVDPEALYRRMNDAGIVLGPEFQGLDAIWRVSGGAIAGLRSGLPLPAVIDSMFQLLAVLVPDTAGPCLPAGFDELILLSDICAGGGVGESWFVQASIRDRADGDLSHGFVGDIWLTNNKGRTLVQISGLLCRPARQRAGSAAVANTGTLYRPVWQQADRLVLPDPRGLADGMVSDRDLSAYPGYLERIDQLAALYAATALERLADGAVLPIYDRLLDRLRALADRASADGNPSRLLAELYELYPAQIFETGMLARCGQSLDLVLTGDADPLALIFAESDDAAAALYRESEYAGALNDLAVAGVGAGLAGSTGRLRVLEIGGGTGGATRHLLPVLRDRLDRYHFTDISPAFLGAAEAAFGDVAGFTTGLLDVDSDLAAQGIDSAGYDLVVASNALHVARDLRSATERLASSLRPGGWLLLVEGLGPSAWLDLTFALTSGWWHATDRDLRPGYPLLDGAGWTALLQDSGFDQLVIRTPGPDRLGDQAVIIARRATSNAGVQICDLALANPAQSAGLPVERVLAWLQQLPSHSSANPPHALILTRAAQQIAPHERPDSDQAAIAGLVRAAALERADWRLRLVDLDPLASDDEVAAIIATEQALGDVDGDVAWRGGQRHVLRLVPDVAATVLPDHFRMVVPQPGSLDGVVITDGDGQPTPASDEVVIRVEAAGLNFKDVLVALGMVDAAPLGGECAGTVVAVGDDVAGGLKIGDRVMAVAGGAMASHVCVPAVRAVRLPPDLSMVQAASLPVAGFTAYHALAELAQLRPRQRVLIHSATGAVGQFALSLVQSAGCRVWATAGSASKRALLKRQGVEAVANSRNADFSALAGGRGAVVDVVLNSLSGDAIPASLALLRPGGCFIELGRVGIWTAEQVAAVRPDVRYHIVSLDRIDDAEGGRLLQSTLTALMEGRMALPPITPWPMARAVAAMQLMSRARHVGKIVLTNPPPFALGADRTVLITGGLGGIGLVLAEWAVERGARHLALAGRSAPDDAALAVIDRLQQAGAAVRVIRADVGQRGDVVRLLDEISRHQPPLGSLFHAAGTLQDGPLAEMTPASLAAVRGAKIDAARYLDQLTRNLPGGPPDHFVLFGSAAGLLGSPGQVNHAAANSAMDALAERRRAEGLPALSIAWGAWRDVGAAARRNVADRLAGSGMGSLSNADALTALEQALAGGAGRVAVLPIDWPALARHFAGKLPPLLRDAGGRPAGDKPVASRPVAVAAPVTPVVSMSHDARVAELAHQITDLAAGLLTGSGKVISQDRPLQEMGLDSLLSVELRNRLARLTGISLPATLLFNHPTISALARHLAGLIGAADPAPVPAPKTVQPVMADTDPDVDDFDAFLSALEERYGS